MKHPKKRPSVPPISGAESFSSREAGLPVIHLSLSDNAGNESQSSDQTLQIVQETKIPLEVFEEHFVRGTGVIRKDPPVPPSPNPGEPPA